MKMTIKGIFSAILCTLILCGCNPEEVPLSTQDVSNLTTSTDTADSDDSQYNSEASDSISQPSATQATSASTAVNTSDEKVQDNSAEPQEQNGFSVDWKLSSTWKEGGMKCGGYEVVITNNTGTAVSGWTLTAAVPNGFELTASWNGIFSVSGNTLTVGNESYNGEIASGGTAGFGFNYRASDEFSPSAVSVNGSAAGTGNGSSQSDEKENNNPAPAETTAQTTTQTAPPAPADPDGTTPVAAHGQLSVNGAQLIDEHGSAYQLRGMSTHGLTWFPDFVNENAFRTLRDDWKTNVVRLAMYVDEWGNGQCYMQNKDGSRQILEKGVDICIGLGMYVIIDWHVLNPGDPSKYTNEAISFFDDISKKYADYPNIIYEIANEPNNGAGWSDNIKPYAEKVIPVIRRNDKDAVIIVGTPTWSQDIDQALADPLDFDNVMYALHFYAATHTDWLRERTEKCVNSGLPVFVSEFGCCDASGGGANDFGQAEKWLSLLDKYGISYCNWSMANKAETCSAFKPSASAGGNWSDSDYSEVGAWIRNWFRSK